MPKINDLSESGRRLAEGGQNSGVLALGDVRGALGDVPGGPWGTRGVERRPERETDGGPKGPERTKVIFALCFAGVNFETCRFA